MNADFDSFHLKIKKHRDKYYVDEGGEQRSCERS